MSTEGKEFDYEEIGRGYGMITQITGKKVASKIAFIIIASMLMIMMLYNPGSSRSAVWADTTYTWERCGSSYSADITYQSYDNSITPGNGTVEFKTTVNESGNDGKQNFMIFTFVCAEPPQTIDAGADFSMHYNMKVNIIKRERTNYPMFDVKVRVADQGLSKKEATNAGNSVGSDFLGYEAYYDRDDNFTGYMPNSSTEGEYKSIYIVCTAGIYEWKYRLVEHTSASEEPTSGDEGSVSDTDYVVKGKLVYAVKDNKATFFYRKSDNLKKVTIPATIKYKGKSIPVTAIDKEAFKGMKKLQTVIIGKNVKKIGKNAFLNCSKLKNITIKTTKLTAKRVGSNAFKGINKKAIVKCPKAKKKAYKKILLKKGMKKTVKFRNL